MSKIIRYIVSGASATAVSLFVTYALTELGGAWYLLSSAVGFCIAVSVSFTLQKFWTFRHLELARVHVEAAQFVLVAITGLICNTILVYSIVEYVHVHYLFAQIAAGVIIAAANFLCYRYIFQDGEKISRMVPWSYRFDELFACAGLLLGFISVRFSGLNLPFHQDEAKIAEIVQHQIVGGLSGHPPLNELIYRWSGYLIDTNYLRLVPLTFGVLSAILLYLVVRNRAGMRAAFVALALYVVCAYGVLASLMIDFDGAILPVFFLMTVYAYDRFRAAASHPESYVWFSVVALTLVLGFLTKLSFVLVLGALAFDYYIEMWDRLTRALMLKIVLILAGCFAVVCMAILSAHIFLPAFQVSQTLAHALSYVRFEGRGYLQILIQVMKAVFYLSPLILGTLLFTTKESLVRNRIFVLYLALGAVFYFVLFDFSQGALDKYLMFSIVPLCALAGTILARLIEAVKRRDVLFGISIGGVCALLLIALNFLSPSVAPLYPKTAWIQAVLGGNWNILMPFTGGSGPLGFYVSFLVIAAGFALSAILALIGKSMPQFRRMMIIAFIVVGITFNAIFIEEFLFGRINGSAPTVLRETLAYIARPDVKEIITHADAGAYELQEMGKYAGRFYAVPGYEEVHRARFAQFKGEYLVVNFPLLNEDGFYAKFFSACTSLFATSSGVIRANVYTCS